MLPHHRKFLDQFSFFNVTSNLRGCPPEKKIRTRAVFKETPTNYISTERLQNVEFGAIIFCFGFCFPKAEEAVKSKMTRSSELIGYQIRSFMQYNCAVLIKKL